ncbi:MAG: DNA polymerase ligase N-terminal domain-containing protein [Pirellulales bacterium]
MPRFVVLHHQCPAELPRPTHWDLMLEHGGTLVTWALQRPPDEPAPIAAERLPDHRLDFLSYQGPLTGGRGSVIRWDEGQYELQEGELGEHSQRLVLRLSGGRLRASATLERVASGQTHWRYTLMPDGPEATSGAREG